MFGARVWAQADQPGPAAPASRDWRRSRRRPTARRGAACAGSAERPSPRGGDTTPPKPSPRRPRGTGRRRRHLAAIDCLAPEHGTATQAHHRVMPEPSASDGRSVDVEWHSLDRPWVFQFADQGGQPPVLAAPNEFDRLLVVECLERLRHPDRDVLRPHHVLQALDDRGELDDASRARSGGFTAFAEPTANGARRRSRRLRDEAIAEPAPAMDTHGFFCKGGAHDLRLAILRRQSVS